MAEREGTQTSEDERLAPVWLEFVQKLDVVLRLERRRSLEQLLTYRAAVLHIISAPKFVAYMDDRLNLADEDVAGHGEESVEHSGSKIARSLNAALWGATRDLGQLQEQIAAHPHKRKWVGQRQRALARAFAVVGCLRSIFDAASEKRYHSQDGLMLLEKLLEIHKAGLRAKDSPRG